MPLELALEFHPEGFLLNRSKTIAVMKRSSLSNAGAAIQSQ
jgi:hypothetical protein